jgi:hypothetical protein
MNTHGYRLLLFFIFCPLAFVLAEFPQPRVIYYGQATDEYGWPYTRDAQVILRIGGVTAAVCQVTGAFAPGVNFALPVDVDDGTGTRFAAAAARVGEPVEIVIRDGVREWAVLAGTVPPIPAAGAVMRVNVTAGTDVNGNGIPDAWDQELVDNSGGVYTNISQVTGDGDLDGDGVCDRDEYRAGTIAYWAFDYFFIERLLMSDGRLALSFLSVPGKAYRVFAARGLPGAEWRERAYALSAGGGAQQGPFSGSGYLTEVFVAPTNTPEIMHLSVEY